PLTDLQRHVGEGAADIDAEPDGWECHGEAWDRCETSSAHERKARSRAPSIQYGDMRAHNSTRPLIPGYRIARPHDLLPWSSITILHAELTSFGRSPR